MRKVLVKQYNGDWTHAPDLDKEISSKTQKQRLRANHLETLLRNLTGSANSYLVLDVIRNEKDQILKVVFPILSVKDWDFSVNGVYGYLHQTILQKSSNYSYEQKDFGSH